MAARRALRVVNNERLAYYSTLCRVEAACEHLVQEVECEFDCAGHILSALQAGACVEDMESADGAQCAGSR